MVQPEAKDGLGGDGPVENLYVSLSDSVVSSVFRPRVRSGATCVLPRFRTWTYSWGLLLVGVLISSPTSGLSVSRPSLPPPRTHFLPVGSSVLSLLSSHDGTSDLFTHVYVALQFLRLLSLDR